MNYLWEKNFYLTLQHNLLNINLSTNINYSFTIWIGFLYIFLFIMSIILKRIDRKILKWYLKEDKSIEFGLRLIIQISDVHGMNIIIHLSDKIGLTSWHSPSKHISFSCFKKQCLSRFLVTTFIFSVSAISTDYFYSITHLLLSQLNPLKLSWHLLILLHQWAFSSTVCILNLFNREIKKIINKLLTRL